MVSSVARPLVTSAPIGIASGSITMSSMAMPYSVVATLTIFSTRSRRLSGSMGISSTSLGSATTAASYFLTSGRICSIRSSSAVIELTSALPLYADSPASSASTTEESMHRGRSVSDWIIVTTLESSSASSTRGTPMFTSRTSAPPSTCDLTSRSTAERSPALIWSWKIRRPVGLIRSPIRQNRCSRPMTTSRVADRSLVSCIGAFMQAPWRAGRTAATWPS